MREPRAPAGIICSLITPFGSDGLVDLVALGTLIDAQVEAGIHGLFLFGTAGEGVLMPTDERKRAAEFAVDRIARRVPTLIHCGAPDTGTAAGLARHAQELGVEAEASVAPFFFAYGAAALERHFRTIAEAAPEIGHYVYENPERVGYSVGVDVVTRLVNEVPNIHGVKDTGDSIGRLTEYLAQPGTLQEVYAGNNSIILPALTIGARGAVSALAAAVPELILSVHDAWRAERLDEARARQLSVVRLVRCVAGLPYLGAIKHLVRRRGLPGGDLRAPQPALSEEQEAELDARLSWVDELAEWLVPVGA